MKNDPRAPILDVFSIKEVRWRPVKGERTKWVLEAFSSTIEHTNRSNIPIIKWIEIQSKLEDERVFKERGLLRSVLQVTHFGSDFDPVQGKLKENRFGQKGQAERESVREIIK
jgi:hypothetical protein